MENIEPIWEFQGEHRFLSNFYPALMVWDGMIWESSEHAYQAAKTLDHELRRRISKMEKPGDVKRLGKTIRVRPDWADVKIATMEEIVRAKFHYNGDLAYKLVDTGDVTLEEGNKWKDRFWGVYPPKSGDGRNELGKILMKIREELKNQRIIFDAAAPLTYLTRRQILASIHGIKDD